MGPSAVCWTRVMHRLVARHLTGPRMTSAASLFAVLIFCFPPLASFNLPFRLFLVPVLARPRTALCLRSTRGWVRLWTLHARGLCADGSSATGGDGPWLPRASRVDHLPRSLRVGCPRSHTLRYSAPRSLGAVGIGGPAAGACPAGIVSEDPCSLFRRSVFPRRRLWHATCGSAPRATEHTEMQSNKVAVGEMVEV